MSIFTVLPNSVRQQVVEGALSNRELSTLATLLLRTLQRSNDALQKGDYKVFDANPGDGGCQARALIFFACDEVKGECAEVAQRTRKLGAIIELAHQGTLMQKRAVGQATEEAFGTVSDKLCFTLLAFMMTSVKCVAKVAPNGIIWTKSDINKLNTLSKGLGSSECCDLRRKLLEDGQAYLSELSISLVHEEGMRFLDPTLNERLLMKKEGRWPGYTPKTFGFLFYQVDALLRCLLTGKGGIVVRVIRPVACLEMKSDGEAFVTNSLDPDDKVVVFEGTTELSKEELQGKITACGFQDFILAGAASVYQFGPKSSLMSEDLKVARYQEKATEIGMDQQAEPFFLLDHIYCQTRRLV